MDEQMFRLQFSDVDGTDGRARRRSAPMKKDRARMFTILRERELAGAKK